MEAVPLEIWRMALALLRDPIACKVLECLSA